MVLTTISPPAALQNIASLRGRDGFEFVQDSAEHAAIVNLLMNQCDAVFHLAAAVGVQLVAEQPIRTIRTTVHGTEVVLEAAQRFGRPMLITSSSEVLWQRNPRPVQRG